MAVLWSTHLNRMMDSINDSDVEDDVISDDEGLAVSYCILSIVTQSNCFIYRNKVLFSLYLCQR